MKQQHGSALIISLLILLVMTMIGISAMSSSTLEERMAASDRTQKSVFQNAEASLKKAEADLLTANYDTVVRPNFANGQAGYYTQDSAAFDYFDASAWTPGTSCQATTGDSNSGGSSCYIIEEDEMAFIPGEIGSYGQPMNRTQITTITVRSTDSSENSAVILQSNLQKNITY